MIDINCSTFERTTTTSLTFALFHFALCLTMYSITEPCRKCEGAPWRPWLPWSIIIISEHYYSTVHRLGDALASNGLKILEFT